MAPSLKSRRCCAHVVVLGTGSCGRPLTVMPQVAADAFAAVGFERNRLLPLPRPAFSSSWLSCAPVPETRGSSLNSFTQFPNAVDRVGELASAAVHPTLVLEQVAELAVEVVGGMGAAYVEEVCHARPHLIHGAGNRGIVDGQPLSAQ